MILCMLDNIYATDPQIGNNGVLTSDISDHYSIFTIRQDVEPKILDKHRYKREFTNKKKIHIYLRMIMSEVFQYSLQSFCKPDNYLILLSWICRNMSTTNAYIEL